MEPIVGEERGQGGSRVFGVVVGGLCQREEAGPVGLLIVAVVFPGRICGGGVVCWPSPPKTHQNNHDTLEGPSQREGDREGGWEEGEEWWPPGCGIGVARKERVGGAPSEVLVFAPVQVVWKPWVVLVCLPKRQRLGGGGCSGS